MPCFPEIGDVIISAGESILPLIRQELPEKNIDTELNRDIPTGHYWYAVNSPPIIDRFLYLGPVKEFDKYHKVWILTRAYQGYVFGYVHEWDMRGMKALSEEENG